MLSTAPGAQLRPKFTSHLGNLFETRSGHQVGYGAFWSVRSRANGELVCRGEIERLQPHLLMYYCLVIRYSIRVLLYF